jgi:hypothetical protein
VHAGAAVAGAGMGMTVKHVPLRQAVFLMIT